MKEFTAHFIRPYLNEYFSAFRFLGKIDLVRAKALVAKLIPSVKPQIDIKPSINWKEAIHPLLFLSLIKQKKKVVPLDLNLNNKNRILIISGQNAGGKSVCLKTAGLLQYMLQCGLLIPVKEGSKAGIFENIFIDIGDEQSLENDLSTYSSHVLNMKFFSENATPGTLFLIDELGTGTEPQMGGAIAEAVLEKMNNLSAFGIITTHYSNLKLLAKEGSGFINGAMLFDSNKIQPLYLLKTGRPGSSFTFEIARKIGFPDQILKSAEKKTGRKQLDFDQQLQQLEVDKKELDQKAREFRVADDFLSELIEKYENLKNDLEAKKAGILAKAREEAHTLFSSSNKLVENTIREIRESQAEKKKTKELREKLVVRSEKLDTEVKQDKRVKEKKSDGNKDQPVKVKKKKLLIGDLVNLTDQDVTGEVLYIKGKDIWLAIGSARLKTTIDKCKKAGEKASAENQAGKVKSLNLTTSERINATLASFNLQVDVRGKRGEEALEMIRKYIDDAIMLKIGEVRIIHGKGYGILRSLIQEYLKTVSEVRKFGDEHVDRGGHGVTIVIFK
ncbi:MAG: Smr/MutS family protein [Bacteroidales bacterium]|nr:Smr/MutS family protein [Bacteroidales bacterium]